MAEVTKQAADIKHEDGSHVVGIKLMAENRPAAADQRRVVTDAVDVKQPVDGRPAETDQKPVVVDAKPAVEVKQTAEITPAAEPDQKSTVTDAKRVVEPKTKARTKQVEADHKPVATESKRVVETKRTVETKPSEADDKPEVTDTRQFVQPDLPGYVGFANLPNQVHRKSVKKGFEFTLMVVGESGLGKSTLINSLFKSDLYAHRVPFSASEKIDKTVKIEASTVDIEERGVKLRLTVVDTPGFGDAMNSHACFQTIVQYVDAQFEKYLKDESGLNRRNIVDSRVHCCFYFISPAAHGLKPVDMKLMRSLHHKVNIIPVIAKADTLTSTEVKKLKQKLNGEIAAAGIQTYSLPDCDDDEDVEYKQQCKLLKEAVPFAVIGSNTVIEVRGRKMRGRMYPWGVVEVENPEHSDFIKLRTLLVTHMQDMQEVTQEVHYENFRHQKLASSAAGDSAVTSSSSKPAQKVDDVKLMQREKELAEKDAQLRNMQMMLTAMQAEMQQKAAAAAAATRPVSSPSSPVSNPTPSARSPAAVAQSRPAAKTDENYNLTSARS